MRFRLSVRPIQDDVSSGNEFHAYRIGIDRIHPRVQGVIPNALFTFAYDIAVFEGVSGDIFARLSDVGDHHSDIGDRHCRHGLDLNRREHRVDKIAACEDHLLLQSFVPARIDKSLRILKGIVVFDFRAGNLAGVQRLAILDRNDAHRIDGYLENLRCVYGKHGCINPIGSRRYDRDLRASLPAAHEKCPGILERFAFDPFAEHSSFRERDSTAGFDHSNRVLRDHQEILQLDPVLPGPEEKMQSGSQGIGLHAGLAIEGHDLAFGQCAVPAEYGVALVHNADAAWRNQHNAKKPENLALKNNDQDQRNGPPIRRQDVQQGLGSHSLSSIRKLHVKLMASRLIRSAPLYTREAFWRTTFCYAAMSLHGSERERSPHLAFGGTARRKLAGFPTPAVYAEVGTRHIPWLQARVLDLHSTFHAHAAAALFHSLHYLPPMIWLGFSITRVYPAGTSNKLASRGASEYELTSMVISIKEPGVDGGGGFWLL